MPSVSIKDNLWAKAEIRDQNLQDKFFMNVLNVLGGWGSGEGSKTNQNLSSYCLYFFFFNWLRNLHIILLTAGKLVLWCLVSHKQWFKFLPLILFFLLHGWPSIQKKYFYSNSATTEKISMTKICWKLRFLVYRLTLDQIVGMGQDWTASICLVFAVMLISTALHPTLISSFLYAC